MVGWVCSFYLSCCSLADIGFLGTVEYGELMTSADGTTDP